MVEVGLVAVGLGELGLVEVGEAVTEIGAEGDTGAH